MAWVAAIGCQAKYDTYSPRINKKKKIKVSLDHIPHHSWVLSSLGNHLEELSKQQWEDEVRRVSLSSLPRQRSRSMDINKINRSDGCIACTLNKSGVTKTNPSLRKTVITRQARSVDSCVNTSVKNGGQSTQLLEGLNCDKYHSHSDYCLRQRRHSGDACHHHHHHHEEKPNIEIVSSHSALKCGTNHKTWTIKVDIRPFLPKGEVMVSAEGHHLKIKAKYGDKHKGFVQHIFGSGQEVKRSLKFAGIVEPSSLRTTSDKEGFLTIDLYEVMP